jgi:hypothetical protein
MPAKLKPGQRCTNSDGVCGPGVPHFYHKPFDKPPKPGAADWVNSRCSYVEPTPFKAKVARLAALEKEVTELRAEVWEELGRVAAAAGVTL